MGLVDVVDSALMHAAGKTAETWSDWTGKTRYSLARALNLTAPLVPVATTGYFLFHHSYVPAVLAAAVSGIQILNSVFFERIVRAEEQLESQLKQTAPLENVDGESQELQATVSELADYVTKNADKRIRKTELLMVGIFAGAGVAYYLVGGHDYGIGTGIGVASFAMSTAAAYLSSVESNTTKGSRIGRAFNAVKSRIPKISMKKNDSQIG